MVSVRLSARRRNWLLIALAIAAAIFLQSSRPSPDLGSASAGELASMIAHLTLYASLAFALVNALSNPRLAAVAGMALLALVYGVSDEVHQSFVDARTGSLGDVGLDAIGSAAGALLGRRWLMGHGRPTG